MRIFVPCLLLALLLIAPWRTSAEPLPAVEPDSVGLASAPLAQVDSLMQSYVDQGKLAGIVLLVAREGKVAHAGVYGKMDIEADRPMRRDADYSAFIR